MMPILEGLDGTQKMSKSLDNYISLTDSPKDMFGKVMSVSDTLMLRYYDLLSRKSVSDIEQIKTGLKSGETHPMTAKKDLAAEIVGHYYGSEAGIAERTQFESVFSKGKIPDEMPEKTVQLEENNMINLPSIIVELGAVKSKNEARRLLSQNAVKLDNNPVKDERIQLQPGQTYILKVGKLHFSKLKVAN